jgi:hypothetical protein
VVRCTGTTEEEASLEEAAAWGGNASPSVFSPAGFAAHITEGTAVIALCGDASTGSLAPASGANSPGAGAMLLRLLRTVNARALRVAAALRLTDPQPAPEVGRHAPPHRLVLELGPMCTPVQQVMSGLSPAMVLLLRVPACDVDAWASFARQLRPGGALLVCGDDAGAAAVAAAVRGDAAAGDAPPKSQPQAPAAPRALITFGVGHTNDWRACHVAVEGESDQSLGFDITFRGAKVQCRLRVPLTHSRDGGQMRATLGALLAASLLDAGAAHASEGGGMDCVQAAADTHAMVTAACRLAEAMDGDRHGMPGDNN